MLGFGQILHSNTFPFQNITAPEGYNKLYDLLLRQGLFIDLELDNYIYNHKTIALLPVNFIYSHNAVTSNDTVKKLEKSIAKCIYSEFITDLYSYSSQYLDIKNAVHKKNNSGKNDSYVHQTQQNKYLENRKHQTADKQVIKLQDSRETYENLNTLDLTNLISYSPEFLSNTLSVDALLFIDIRSDVLIPIKNCLSSKNDRF